MSKKGSMIPGTVITDTQTGITASIVGRHSDGKYKAIITKKGFTPTLTRVSSIPPAEDTDAQAEFVKKMEYALEVESKKKTSPPRKVKARTGKKRIFMVSTVRNPQTKTVKSRAHSRSRSRSRSKTPSPKIVKGRNRTFKVSTVKRHQRGGKKHRKTHRKKSTKKTKKNKSKK